MYYEAYFSVPWEIDFHPAFDPEYEEMAEAVQDELLAHLGLLGFDPNRHGIILCGGDKSGGSEKRFYRQLIDKADSRFDAHVERTKRKNIRRGNSHEHAETENEGTQPRPPQKD
jgi:hypothetical protein